MPHHYTKEITEAPYWCNRCNRITQHRVSCCRLQHCLEHESQHMTKAQMKRAAELKKQKLNPTLFD